MCSPSVGILLCFAARSYGGGVNRPTDQMYFLPGFRIQSENFNGLADPAIAAVCGFHRFFWVRILDFACDKVRIVDLSGGGVGAY